MHAGSSPEPESAASASAVASAVPPRVGSSFNSTSHAHASSMAGPVGLKGLLRAIKAANMQAAAAAPPSAGGPLSSVPENNGTTGVVALNIEPATNGDASIDNPMPAEAGAGTYAQLPGSPSAVANPMGLVLKLKQWRRRSSIQARQPGVQSRRKPEVVVVKRGLAAHTAHVKQQEKAKVEAARGVIAPAAEAYIAGPAIDDPNEATASANARRNLTYTWGGHHPQPGPGMVAIRRIRTIDTTSSSAQYSRDMAQSHPMMVEPAAHASDAASNSAAVLPEDQRAVGSRRSYESGDNVVPARSSLSSGKRASTEVRQTVPLFARVAFAKRHAAGVKEALTVSTQRQNFFASPDDKITDMSGAQKDGQKQSLDEPETTPPVLSEDEADPMAATLDTVRKASLALSFNSLVTFFVDTIVQFLILWSLLPSQSLDLGYLFISLVSVMLACHTVANIRKDELETTSQSLRVGAVVEFALVIMDTKEIFYPHGTKITSPTVQLSLLYVRIGFVAVGLLNVVLRFVIIHKLRVWREVFAMDWTNCLKKGKLDHTEMEQTFIVEPETPAPPDDDAA